VSKKHFVQTASSLKEPQRETRVYNQLQKGEKKRRNKKIRKNNFLLVIFHGALLEIDCQHLLLANENKWFSNWMIKTHNNKMKNKV
jgi:hypothetical protein